MDNGASSYRRFLDGDDSGFVEIIRDYKDGLILYLNSFTGNIHTAEELAEDTFVKLGIKRPRHHPAKASFKTWLYTIGRNVALDFMRKKPNLSTISTEDCLQDIRDEEALELSYLREEVKITVHRALGKLRPEYRQILWLIYFEGFSNREAANVMKKTVHSIETLVYRARLSLKAELDKEGFVYEDLS